MSEIGDLVRGAAPGKGPKPYVHVAVVTVDQRGPLRCRLLSDKVWGTFLHHDQRSFICKESDSCKGCSGKLAKRWAGWVPACSWDYRQRWVVKVTAGALQYLSAIRERHEHLTGLPLVFTRVTKRVNAAVRVEVANPPDVNWDCLPHYFDPRGVVWFLHGEDDDTIAERLRTPDPCR